MNTGTARPRNTNTNTTPPPPAFRFFFSSRTRLTISLCDFSSDLCSSDLWENCPLKLTSFGEHFRPQGAFYVQRSVLHRAKISQCVKRSTILYIKFEFAVKKHAEVFYNFFLSQSVRCFVKGFGLTASYVCCQDT